MADNIAVVYADNSKVVRRIIVSDTEAELESAIILNKGESVVLIPFQEYTKANAEEVNDFIAKLIGPPTKQDRCVEINSKGLVVASYSADPLLDVPIIDQENTIEIHDLADTGDIKLQQTGEFVSMKPVPVLTKSEILDRIEFFTPDKFTPEEKDALANSSLSEQSQKLQKQEQAQDQIAKSEVVSL